MNAQLRRMLLDLGPLIAFFVAFQFFGIYVATGTFMVLVMVSLAFGYWRDRKLSPIALFTAAIVLIFGGLTLWLKNDTFVKMKPTVIYATFCAVLLGGLAFN
ncbi:MAG: inner membrane-spanning protein YciB, partial [Casimicrobiaceae bacterium]